MSTTIGTTTQTALQYQTDNVSTSQPQPLLRFVSEPLAAQTITETDLGGGVALRFRIAFWAGNSNSNFFYSACLVVWRPGLPGTVVGRHFDGVFIPIEQGPSGTSQDVGVLSIGTPSANLDDVTAQAGDVLVLELWRGTAAQTMATSYTNTFPYDGTQEATTTSDYAAHVEMGYDLIFQGAGPAPSRPYFQPKRMYLFPRRQMV